MITIFSTHVVVRLFTLCLLFLGESIVLYSVYQTQCNLVLQVNDGKLLELDPDSVKRKKTAAVP
jgi:hypothetical protein